MTNVQSSVTILFNRIYHQDERIGGEMIKDFECLNCRRTFDGTIEEDDVHSVECSWRYFVACPICQHKSNLAMIKNVHCTC